MQSKRAAEPVIKLPKGVCEGDVPAIVEKG
jgi:hypothetical protein